MSTSRHALAFGGFNNGLPVATPGGTTSDGRGGGAFISGRRRSNVGRNATSCWTRSKASATSVAPTTEDDESEQPSSEPSPWGIEVEDMYARYGEGPQAVRRCKLTPA